MEARPSLGEFLAGVSSRTGDPLEGAALAEMSGYSVADARLEGWSDIFAAAAAVPSELDRGSSAPVVRRRHVRRSALARGLTYTLPVLSIWALLPRPISTAEIRFLAVLVVLSWGGSMAATHVIGSVLPGNALRAWRIAGLIATTMVLMTVLSGGYLLLTGVLGLTAVVVGAIQVLYFFCASPLMLREHNLGLGAAAVLGASAGLAATEMTLRPDASAAPESVLVLRAVAAACLVLPAPLLVRQVKRARRELRRPGFGMQVLARDVAAFGAYGLMFGCLVLWIPIVDPSSPASILSLVVIAGISGAEVAVADMRRRTDRLLERVFDPRRFAPRARRRILAAAGMYVVPIGLATFGLALLVTDGPVTAPATLMAGLTVCLMGGIQVLSLIGMSLHGIRQVSLAITLCASMLMVLTPFVTRREDLIVLFLGVLATLAVLLVVQVLRLGGHPINFL